MLAVGKWLALASLLLTAGCVPGSPPTLDPVSASVGQAFGLRVGQTANIEPERLGVLLVGIVSDTRCPSNVQCAVSGELIVEVQVTKDGQDLGKLELDHICAYRDKDKRNAGEFNVAVLKASPGRIYQDYGKPWGRITTPASNEYVVDLIVNRP